MITGCSSCGWGPALPLDTGVEQGCPLSPTLFGLLADGLHRSLQFTAADSGVSLYSGFSITDLAYADDFALVSGSPAGLQHLINAAVEWCPAVGMRPSLDKTVVMEMTKADQPQHSWQCGGTELKCVSQARYFGMIFRSGQNFQPTLAIWSSAYGPATTFCASAIRTWSAATAFGSRFGCMPHAWSQQAALEVSFGGVTGSMLVAASAWRRLAANPTGFRLTHVRSTAYHLEGA